MISWKKLCNFFSTLCPARADEDASKSAPTISLDEIRRFLPTYLSQGSDTAFLEEIKHFLKSGSHPFYTEALRDKGFIFQGDGLDGLLIINLPDTATKRGVGMVLSNSCDINPSNDGLFDASLCYAPIFSLPAYLAALRKEFAEERVAAHERDLRNQSITQIFFLPKGGKLANDAIVFLDRIVSIANDTVKRDNLPVARLFTLSDFGAWLLTLKLSIHLCRIRDKVDRIAGVIA